MKKSSEKKLKLKKIPLGKNKKIIDLFYIQNDFYYSIIYYPKKTWWEPNKNPSSHESVCLSSKDLEEPGQILLLRTSLQPHGEKNKIIQKIDNENLRDSRKFNRSELICKK